MIFVGIDWAEAHHDICVLDREGTVLATRRIPEGLEGVSRLHALLGEHAEQPDDVVVGIETDRGLLVTALLGAGYAVHAVNPLSASRYRERHTTSRAKSDRADARMLADLVRTDRGHHRQVAPDSELHGAVKILARAHQNLIWSRQRQLNALRSALREYYPGARVAFEELGHPDALAVLAVAPTPELGRRLSEARIITALRRGGRKRNLEPRAKGIRAALRQPQLEAPASMVEAQAANTVALVAVITTLGEQIARLEAELTESFERHPDAEILRSLPGLGAILGARVLAEFGDAPDRYLDAKARRNYAGTAPITRASGTSHVVVARLARNKRLFDACYQWALCALTAEEVRELGVGPEDECYMVGRLVTHGGRLTNNPVARFGNIALMPTKAEPIRDGRGRDVIAYLIEMRSHSGFSGSPVFLLIPANTFRGRFGGVKNDNTTRFRLLGIDTGHLNHHEWIEEQQEDNTWSKRPDLRVAYNTDIAIVAPISQLVRLLEREDLVAERQRHDDEAEPGHESAK